MKSLASINFLAFAINYPLLVNVLLAIIIFTLIGLIVLGLVYLIFTLIIPVSLRKELEIKENPALSVIIGAFVIAVAIIIGAAISS